MEMPWHDIGMVLQDGNDDVIALANDQTAKTLGDQIDGVGCITRKDNLVARRCIQEPSDAFPGIFKGLCRGIRQVMQPAMHIGIFFRISRLDPIQHYFRLLCRCTIVEIGQRLVTIDRSGQNRKIRPDFFDVISGRRKDLLGNFIHKT